jgi:hypothetical protein
MSDSYLSAFLAPIVTLGFVAIVGLIARAILKRIPDGKVKSILNWPPDPSAKAGRHPPR